MHHGSCGCMSVRGNDAGRIGIRPTRLLGRDGDLTQCPRSPTTVSRRSSTNVAALRNDELLERLVAAILTVLRTPISAQMSPVAVRVRDVGGTLETNGHVRRHEG